MMADPRSVSLVAICWRLADSMYDDHDSDIRAERLVTGRDHCESAGRVYALTELVVRNRIVDPESGVELATSGERRLIYAVDSGGRIHVGFDGDRGVPHAVKHETLFHNAPVEAAGEMRVANGVIVEVNDRSGSYGTIGQLKIDRRMAQAVLTALQAAEVPLTSEVLDFLEARADL